MNKYFILTGDIVGSRKKDSLILWEKLNKIINKADNQFNNLLLSPLQIKKGDEFQVVVQDIESVLSLMYYLDICFLSEDIEARFAIGYGKIESNVNRTSTNNMLGSGLTYTNQILNNKKNKYSFYIQDDIYKNISLNTIAVLLEDSLSSVTKKQIIYLYKKVVEKMSDEQLLIELDIKERNLYRYEVKSKHKLINDVFLKISQLFMTNEVELKTEYYKKYKIQID
ncbi:SatD family protein [Poseidonibacter ostreae]|jgi:hypothetical protein|uniref:Uncharacterized protein n=1 Tax=Poseidonibacter ostreae TaxID=2654171 RepID=A0A6L4WUP7_9BACT|nr:SatD family protein [Poseidonibacter ostreae]KAB7887055.1 hypothetical protein GA417_03255 [Poseidonibacter ostreae]KAB7889221.1 hypothetical protein GBG19_06925 [Poseidonibacter ostreae]KAB7891578.1 hypothetical protein GBG18_06315 [Poseidonibacter ostreae]MAC84088.1 hypothetical protein [Arcobacter sp.]|tara:strand:+ start:733 stop:1407 length:675 start_codon:yes stop_codon:yes gene_type:complete